MSDRAQSEILVITTHYPFGSIEENWIAPEIFEFARRFAKVHVFPVKELNGCRDLPENVELWPPLATRNRMAFFAWHGLMPKTWLYFFDAMRECITDPGINPARTALNFKFACYRAAFERNARLKRFLAPGKPKVVYAYWGHLPALAIPLAHERGAGTCVRYHAGDLYVQRPEVGGFYPWRRELRATSALNAFISEHGREYYLGLQGGRPKGMNKVFRLGSRDQGGPRLSEDNGENGIIVMVSASWISPIKRVELIAELAGELAKARKVVWHHFGSGSISLELEARISITRRLGVEVIFHGQVCTEKLQEFYRECAISFFVNLSRDEGIPVSIMEALNAGIPVVATAVGGTAEVVIEGRAGLLVDPKMPSGMAALAERILDALAPGGLFNDLDPRRVWEEFCDAQALAERFSRELISIAKEITT